MASLARYTLSFYVPHSALQACKDALFAAGAGTYPGDKYSHACFETVGTGQFRPNEGAVPNVGVVGQVERVAETKVEMICVGRGVMERSATVLKEAHPYEEVPYYVVKMEDV
jgi:hypothetical protein